MFAIRCHEGICHVLETTTIIITVLITVIIMIIKQTTTVEMLVILILRRLTTMAITMAVSSKTIVAKGRQKNKYGSL